jgi:RHS repeat-associated protein
LVYKYVNGELQLESAGFGGGRIIASEGSNGAIYEPHYFITDHLGSTRAIVKPNATSESGLEVLERNDYLPFGMKWQNPNALISDNRWLYNGKELQTVGLPAGVHFLDYGARVYDPEIIRLKTQDKLATQYYSTSPYAYVGNNPTKYLDVGGNFRLSADFVKQYPRLANYLRYDIQDILNNPTIMSALQKHGELTEDQIKADLTWGQGPEINVVSAGSGGLFIPGSSRLNIISDWVSYLEEATGLSKEATLFIVGTILLHEYVHYGDDQDDVPRGEYPVELFEKAAYGQQISGMKNAVEIATKIWKDWYDRQEQAKEQAKDNFQEDTQTYSDDDIFSGNVPEGTYTWNGSGWERQY